MSSYARVYKNIKPEAVEATKSLMPRIWQMDESGKVFLMLEWLQNMSALYGVPMPAFEFKPNDRHSYRKTGGGQYFPDDNKIVLYRKASVVTLAHEFRHMMQVVRNVKRYLEDDEHDARAWSVSLFKLANPKGYKRAVAKGTLHFN